MKKQCILILICVFLGLYSIAQKRKSALSIPPPPPPANNVPDARIVKFNAKLNGSSSIKSITIGNQTWMAENLDVSAFKNGDPIPEAKTKEEWLKACIAKKAVWCYYNNDPANGKKFGKLYNWYAVKDSRGLAPAGWHIPKEAEWDALIYKLGGKDVAAKKMKSTGGWKNGGNGTNESGFNALPGSFRDPYSTFYEMGSSGYWWSSSEFITGTAGYGFEIEGGYSMISKNIYEKDGLSVRCLKD